MKSDPQEHNGDEEEDEEDEEEEEDMVPPCGPIRIRNLEDLLRQLEHPPPPLHHTSGSDLRLSEPEADRHYRVDRTDSASGTESQLEPGLQFYLGQHRFSNHDNGEEEQMRDFKEEEERRGEEEEEFDSDEEEEGEGGYEPGGGFVRCASEEALNYTIANHAYDTKNYDKNKLVMEKGGVVNKMEYVPSPPSDSEGVGGGGKGYFPPPVIPSRVAAPPSSSSSTSGSQPPSGAKRKGKKKFPEYKV